MLLPRLKSAEWRPCDGGGRAVVTIALFLWMNLVSRLPCSRRASCLAFGGAKPPLGLGVRLLSRSLTLGCDILVHLALPAPSPSAHCVPPSPLSVAMVVSQRPTAPFFFGPPRVYPATFTSSSSSNPPFSLIILHRKSSAGEHQRAFRTWVTRWADSDSTDAYFICFCSSSVWCCVEVTDSANSPPPLFDYHDREREQISSHRSL